MNKSVKTTEALSSGVRTDGITINIDLALCIGAGPCAIAAGRTFGIRDEDGKAIILDPDGDSQEAIVEAAKSCPVNAIILKNKTGKQLHP